MLLAFHQVVSCLHVQKVVGQCVELMTHPRRIFSQHASRRSKQVKGFKECGDDEVSSGRAEIGEGRW